MTNATQPYSGADFDRLFAAMPLVAILRGITPATAEGVDSALADAGIGLIEVPLNSPDALVTISRFAAAAQADRLIGAGTVLDVASVEAVAARGGWMVVAPNCDIAVIARARALGLACAPGVMTPTEAFAALGAGAGALKLFPAELITPAAVKAMRAVLPRSAKLIMVGGIAPADMAAYLAAGADGFGIGSALYRPGESALEVAAKARVFVEALHLARSAG